MSRRRRARCGAGCPRPAYTPRSTEAATSALDYYPLAVVALLPELERVSLESEPRSDCARCPLVPARSGADPSAPWAFHPELRCCTFQPNHPNFLVGQALNRGGVSERLTLARMEEPDGLEALGIRATRTFQEQYAEISHEAFGHDASLRCPYWAGGDLACGVWRDRAHICRTWHCQHEHGEVSRQWWRTVAKALGIAEYAVAKYCVGAGEPPPPGAPAKEWEAWYRWCADCAANIPPADLAELRDQPSVVERREPLQDGAPEAPVLPDVVVTSVSSAKRYGDRIWVTAYSAYDPLVMGPSVFVFFSKLDGARPWREALAETNAETDEPITEAQIRELFRIGGIRDPEPGDVRGTESDMPGVESLGDGVYLRFFD